jgi:hypothetical protein
MAAGRTPVKVRDRQTEMPQRYRGKAKSRSVVNWAALGGKGDRIAKTAKRMKNGYYWLPDKGMYKTWSRGNTPIDSIIIHTAEGYSGTSIANAGNIAACHYAITYDGKVFQMLDEKTAGVCSNEANSRGIGIEHAGFSHVVGPAGSEGEGMWGNGRGGLSPQLKASAKLVAEISYRHKIPVDKDHIFGHGEIASVHDRTDPGPYWPWQKYYALIKKYRKEIAYKEFTGPRKGRISGEIKGRSYGGAKDIIKATPWWGWLLLGIAVSAPLGVWAYGKKKRKRTRPRITRKY